MPHGRHIYSKASDISKDTMRAYPMFDRELTHCKCVLRFCANYPSINLTEQETDNHYSGITPSIRIHIYHIIVCCTAHGIFPLK